MTSVVYSDGTLSTQDPVVGHKIVDNLSGPLAKIADPNYLYGWHTIVFGLKFGIQWGRHYPERDADMAFHGNWSRSVITLFNWKRVLCYSHLNHGKELFQNSLHKASQSKSTIRDISWGNLGGSEALRQLREAAGDGELAVRINLSYHTTNYPPYVAHNATLGYVVGALGVPSPSDTLNVPGERAMFFRENPVGLSFPSNDLCSTQDPLEAQYNVWTNVAPFELDRERREVRIDLSNSLPADLSNSLYNLGTLHLGVLTGLCVQLLGDESGLPYAPTDELPVTSGIYRVPIMEASLMWAVTHHPLVLAQPLTSYAGSTPICNQHHTSPSPYGPWKTAQILLQEYPYYVRPKGMYTDALDRRHHPTGSQTVYVTKYGEPVVGVPVQAVEYLTFRNLPQHGVIPVNSTVRTDERGLATFLFKLKEDELIPAQRHFVGKICEHSWNPDNRTVFPVPGLPHYFKFCVEVDGVNCDDYDYVTTYMHAYSDVDYTRPYTWVRDVEPIFSMYAHTTPVMKKILDLSSYHQVTLPHILHLLNRTLRLDIDHPSYMPTTRELSPTARKMILEWLEDPRYDLLNSNLPLSVGDEFSAENRPWTAQFKTTDDELPPRCKHSGMHFQEGPHQHDSYFDKIFSAFAADDLLSLIGRPLLSSVSGVSGVNCSIENVKQQLQLAIQLEWATIPVYLTALYSIKEGHNAEIYNLTRSIVTQEMLHMTQSANILIAMHGSPLIDHPSVIPSFPITGLPGGVLPLLQVTLERFSLGHAYRVFLGIELPQSSFVAYPPLADTMRTMHTIGTFYDEIKFCVDHLGDKVFDPATLDLQVKWPWVPTDEQGGVVPVTDSDSAKRAIDNIMSQGEGASVLDPTQVGSHTLAHFFKFEEIVCQRHLEKVNDFKYAYSGSPIPFDPSGVWPMRSNPKASTVLPETNCYIEARIFHRVYRNLLHQLQRVFNGHPEEVFATVQLMKSLELHAKRLMWIEHRPDDPDDDSTCGPVWDYFWPEE